ncbi:restriction endonuclease subunit S [Paenibacillus odorifer]|uniref:Type I restriction modification DNA specificity domain-containing protein n=1 Tax=Paenibacillus odorifer TaxID=189426 RepID=A0A1R0Y9J3_9BACL|nr:restriction endonuclease subunit S [Paenibacillus odorifer]OMD44048.1 hypothetical protein BSK52_00415 [Paenibacillus odorifer]
MSFENHDWSTLTLDELCQVTDCQHKTAPTVTYKTQFRMLRTTNIRKGRIISDDARYVTEETYEAWSVRGKLVENDVILTREAPMGEVGIIKSTNEKFFLGQRMLQLKAKTDKILPYFLYYSLLAPEVQNQIKIHEGTGSVVSNIRIPALKKFKLKVPALKTQEAVVNILRGIDDKIDLNNNINKNLEEMAQALFKRWFVDFEFPNENGEPYKSSGGEFEGSDMGLIPKGWGVGTFGDITVCFDSKRIPLSKQERESLAKIYPYYGAASLMDKVDDYLFDGVFVLMGEDGSVIDDAGYPILQYVWGKFWVNNHAHVLKGKSSFSEEYIYLLLKRTYVNQIVTGAVQPKINQKNMNSLKVVIPTNYVLLKFNDIVTEMFELIRNGIDQNSILTSTRESILPKLMSGEIRVPVE